MLTEPIEIAQLLAQIAELRAALEDIRERVVPCGEDYGDAGVLAVVIAALALTPPEALAKLRAREREIGAAEELESMANRMDRAWGGEPENVVFKGILTTDHLREEAARLRAEAGV